jgi:tRNA 2-thiouridine synthesizing protein A
MAHMAEPTATWDAGTLGCGELLVELRRRMRDQPPGTVLRVISADPGAPEEIPAWCRLTGTGLAGRETLAGDRFQFDLVGR